MKQKEEQIKDNSAESEEYIKWFSDMSKDSVAIAGGKGANLSEIYNLKIPVPPGFVVTTKAYHYFIEKSGVKEEMDKLLGEIDYEATDKLTESAEKIRNLIIKSEMPKEIEEEIIEAYDHLNVKDEGVDKDTLNILEKNEPGFVAVRSSATTEDLADASFAGQQDTFLNVKGEEQLLKSIKKCFASLFTARATYYRNKKGFKHEGAGLAVIVQRMVDADKSGVIFSKDPAFKNENTIIEAVYGLGEGIVSGKITPDRYVVSKDLKILKEEISDKKIAITKDKQGKGTEINLSEEKSKSSVLNKYELHKLTEFALKLEKHYNKPQDIEFAIEDEKIYIVQTRAITTIGNRVDVSESKIEGEAILKGIPASPGIASGKIRVVKDLSDLGKVKKGDVLVTQMTNPDMVVTMQKSAAIVTDQGGLTSHAAIVSREMGIPAIVGTREATIKLKDGEVITVDGSSGKVYKGKVAETQKKQILPVTAKTKTKIKVMLDLPSFAERASKTELTGVGLLRLEGIIAESEKHPQYFLEQGKMGAKEYEEIIYKGVSEIAKYFEELWIRTSDIRSDEFKNLKGSPKNSEANPMLGFHGIRYSLKNPDILKAELNALKRVAEKNKKIGLLLPQVISVEEVQGVKKSLNEINFNDAKVGVMIETPASVQIIKELTEEGIDFISFGTNDLTQYTLAVDRGNQKVQDIYNEMHPAILHQLEHVIKICKEANIETSICGQAGSRKEMAKFLVEKRIDSISVNADMAKEISDYVLEIESGEKPSTEPEQQTRERPEPKSSEEKKENSQQESTNQEQVRSEKQNINEKYYQENQEQIDNDIKAIEEEKKEYQKDSSKELMENKPDEDKEESRQIKQESNQSPQQENSEENIKDDIEATEKEKQEYQQNRYSSDEEENEQSSNEITEEQEINKQQEMEDHERRAQKAEAEKSNKKALDIF